jgi:hypothetical protein
LLSTYSVFAQVASEINMRQVRFPVFLSLLLLTACFLRTQSHKAERKHRPFVWSKSGSHSRTRRLEEEKQGSVEMINASILRQEQAAEKGAAEKNRAKRKEAELQAREEAELQAKAQEELQAKAQEGLQAVLEAKEQAEEAKKKPAQQQAKEEAEAKEAQAKMQAAE